MKSLTLCTSAVLLLTFGYAHAATESTSADPTVAAAPAELLCLRGKKTIQAFPTDSWEACGVVEIKLFNPYTTDCKPVVLKEGTDSLRIYRKGHDLRLDVNAEDNSVTVRNLSMLPALSGGGNVLYYQGASEGIHYYLYQDPEKNPNEGFWYVEIYDTGKLAPTCDKHRISAPQQLKAGACKSDTRSVSIAEALNTRSQDIIVEFLQGATGGGGGNKPIGLTTSPSNAERCR